MNLSLNVGDNWTPLKVVQWATVFLTQKGISSARLDSELLVAHALNLDRLKIYLQFDRPLQPEELSIIRGYLVRRSKREPIQYIMGMKDFFGFNFKVSPSVLIPRPETELLVENTIEFLRSLPDKERSVLDLGTGSGCIAISIALNIFCGVWAVDISREALEMGNQNAEHLKASQFINWRLGQWFSALWSNDPSQFSVVVCNPPYVAYSERKDLMPEIVLYEPGQAIFSGESGLEAYQELAPNLWNHLRPGGRAYLELHSSRHHEITALFYNFPWRKQEVISDLQGLPRILVLEKSDTS
jgi:release factor glutamine methyltransferase